MYKTENEYGQSSRSLTAAMETLLQFLLLLGTFINTFFSASSQPYVGVNYGEIADNLPPPESTAHLLQSTTISKLRLYGADPAIIRALAGTNISLIIGTTNGEIASLAANPSAAVSWVSSNVLPFLPATSISAISVGNEILTAGDPTLSSQLLPAMQNLKAAIPAGIKISTVHSMAVLSQSDPPSSGMFKPDLAPLLKPILQFLHDNESPFMVNPYPYFAYQSDQRAETLAFCLFQPNSGRPDPGSGVTYTNMFDAQVAAVRAALVAAGFAGAEVVVAETGWPYNGDAGEAGATLENAKAYNGNLVAHLRGMGEPIETYIFALYDEDLKPGPTSERSFGLFKTDLTPIYDAGLTRSEGGTGQAVPAIAPAPTTAEDPIVPAISAAPAPAEDPAIVKSYLVL
ncbi:glucan endo-1,3-beta-glucosidase 7-like [Phalaenopsis equestris]|uniref:glucan endo-1,3-beta-glucosidase 7-like n=1 Tax=Phalaenopsis equestris TaxID=78828 RepID=UPI0009E3E6C6|nr:glucan endo-1,3-beta-glucosidase 7-like [Phalaenopsis equestris]